MKHVTKKVMMTSVAATMLMGCGNSSAATATSSASSSSSDAVNIAVVNDMNTMNSSIVTDGTSMSMISLCQSGLLQYDKNGEVAPDLAESYEMSEDGKTYTFHIRKNMKWSNGTPITANDFVYGWRRVVDPDVASEYNYFMTAVNVVNAQDVIDGKKSVEELGVEATDDYTFIVHLDLPCGFFTSVLPDPIFFPQNEEYVESQGDQYALSCDTMIYSGAYTMTNWVTGNTYTFTHNEDYWDADNYPQQEINILYVPDAQSAVMQYDSGNLDYVSLTGEMVDKYKDDKGYQSTLSAAVWYLCPNMEDEAISNENLRKAIAYAIDRQSIVNDVLKTGAVEADGYISRGISYDSEGKDFRDIAGDLTEYNPDKAKEYYQKAVKELGYDPTVDILYDDAEDSSKVAENIQQMIQTSCPGITITLTSKPKKSRIEAMFAHDFQLGLTRWGPDYADPQSFMDLFTTGASMNFGNYSNTEFDELVNAATKGADATDSEKRLQDFVKAENIVVSQDYGLIPVYQEGGAIILNPNVEGYLNLVIGAGTYRHMHKVA